MPDAFHGLLISDFTIDVLASYLQNSGPAPRCTAKAIPFGSHHQILLDDSHPLWKENHDFLVFWHQPSGLLPSFAKLMDHTLEDPSALKEELNHFIEMVKTKAACHRFCFVVSLCLPYYYRGLGPIDYKQGGVHYWLDEINHSLMEEFSGLPNVIWLDAGRWTNAVGPAAFNPKLWYMSKVPFDPAVFKMAGEEIKNSLLALTGGPKKIILLDLDNVLWGGEVGEIGWENIQLGGHDPAGEAYADFQRALKGLKNRGILLGIVSKNDESRALEAIDKHPEMILKKNDFTAWKINWQDKAQNIVDLLGELNLTASAAVFIDDHPAERDRVRKAFPEVTVPDWPDQSVLYSKALLTLPYFDAGHFQQEDKDRSLMYAQEKQRRTLQSQAVSLESWLKSLNMKVFVEELNEANLPRATQLLNKTNQMNLTTRRLSQEDFKRWLDSPKHRAWCFRAADSLGDSGLVGLVSLDFSGQTGQVVDFILSCRVFGRKIEHVMTAVMVKEARQMGVSRLVARYLPSSKNQPCLEFFRNVSGFEAHNDIFEWEISKDYPLPSEITLILPQATADRS